MFGAQECFHSNIQTLFMTVLMIKNDFLEHTVS